MALIGAALAPALALLAAWAALAAWLERVGRRPPPRRRWDLLVVAGCRVLPDGRPSPALARRTALALELHRAGAAPRILLTGGLGRDAPITEARCAADLCLAAGVPESSLVLEERSTTTQENASRSLEVLGHGGFDLLVVTDAAHAFRCRRVFGRRFRSVESVGATAPGPRARARLALREALAVVRHGLSGRL